MFFLKTNLNLNYMFINLSHCDLSSRKMYLLGNMHIHVKCSNRYCFVFFMFAGCSSIHKYS